ncbi:MAG: UDP-N-acetylmuramoyl-L-alanine--D-glutamate ligase [Egibacteraceae bacterium]
MLRNANIVILGFGKEGLSSYGFLRAHLPSTRLAFADQLDAEHAPLEIQQILDKDPDLDFIGGKDYESCLANFDVIFRSPGIPPTLPGLQAARTVGARVTSNTELFFELCPGRVIGVTGTKGKSTTASLIFSVLQAARMDARLVGNIGYPALSRVNLTASTTTYVVELSSHQLADLTHSPHIAVVHHVVPEHADYYGTFARYLAAKTNIARHQGANDYIVGNADSTSASKIVEHSRAVRMPFGFDGAHDPLCTLEQDWLVYRNEGRTERVIAAGDVPLRGRFNLLNVMATVIVGKLLEIPNETIARAVGQFQALEHRLELVATIHAVSFYNDSLATVPEATIAALESFAEPVVLIAGGEDRGQDFTQLATLVRERGIRGLVLLPPSGDRVRKAVEATGFGSAPPCWSVDTMRDAVRAAVEAARAGDVVLLSPGSASHGLFRNYTDRGNRFRRAVQELASDNRHRRLH